MLKLNVTVSFMILIGSFSVMAASESTLTEVRPSEAVLSNQVHVRTGLISTKFEGLLPLRNSTFTTLAADCDLFSTQTEAYNLMVGLSYDPTMSSVNYMHVGIGRRFYLNSESVMPGAITENGDPISSYKFFLGPDLGISNKVVLSKTFGSLVANDLDLGLSTGVIYQISPSFGLEFYGRGSRGFSFGTISANDITLEAMIGITQFF